MSDGAQEVWYAQQAYQRSLNGERSIRAHAACDAKDRYGRVISLALTGDRACADEVTRVLATPQLVRSLELDHVALIGALPAADFDSAFARFPLGIDDRARLIPLLEADEVRAERVEWDVLHEASRTRRRDLIDWLQSSPRPGVAGEAHRLAGYFLAEDLRRLIEESVALGSIPPYGPDVLRSVSVWQQRPALAHAAGIADELRGLVAQAEPLAARIEGRQLASDLRTMFSSLVSELAIWQVQLEHVCRRAEAWLAAHEGGLPEVADELRAEVGRARSHGRSWAAQYLVTPGARLMGRHTARGAPAGLSGTCPCCFAWYRPEARYCTWCGTARTER